MKNVRIGDRFIEYGYASKTEIDEALEYQKVNNVRLGEALLQLGYITEEELLFTLSKALNVEKVELGKYPIDDYAVGLIPKQVALQHHVIAIAVEGSILTIATNDPLDLYAHEEVRLVTNKQIKVVVAKKSAIKEAIELHYSQVEAIEAASEANKNLIVGSNNIIEDIIGREDENAAPIVKLLNRLITSAYNTNVSDIHIEPYEKETVIRFRRDGMLLQYMVLSPSIHKGLVARTKIMANMDIAEKRKPQDGHFKLTVEGVEINVRVSFVPTIFGEKGVLRLLTTNIAIDNSDTFGMSEINYNKLTQIIKKPHGLIYVTGPTGSGKSTTLYSILEYLSNKPYNIITIEDPVEKQITKINQIQINEKAGVTFATGLRSILRQDPDIIMVGETRDVETAQISAQSALTGHLVFSTLHTNDAISSIARLVDMGIPPYLVSASLVGVVAQRLIKKVCSYCAVEHEATDSEMEIIYGKEYDKSMKRPMLKKGKGCYNCSNTGYLGRIAVHEIVNIDRGIRKLILDQAGSDEINQYAKEKLNMYTMKDEVTNLVINGIVGVEEIEKINYSLD